uniref:Major facilitator superfamily (MFS) profile domain-containing protein n=1 Tax=Anopheles dirus TaxID=7168 RepID=A0A182N0A5_9DIPT
MGRELGKVQQQNSSRRIISNQSSSSSSSSSSVSSQVKMRQPLLDARWTSVLYTLVASLTYVTAGTMVGWSSGSIHRSGASLPLLDNWSISLAATPAIVISVTACVVHRCYRWVGTKAFLLTATVLASGSSALDAYGTCFWSASVARVLAGIAAGIALTLVPSYVDEFGACGQRRPPLDVLLATAFPFGVLLRFGADLLPYPTDPHWNAVRWAALPTCAFLGLLFLPESARYLCATGRVSQAAALLQRTHEPTDQPALQELLARWQQPAPGLLEAVQRQANLTLLIPLLGLFAFQACVGALPMLFYLADLLALAGHRPAASSPQAAALVAATLTATVALTHYLPGGQRHRRPLLALSALGLAVAALALGWHCHAQRTRSPAHTEPLTDWPLYGFALLYAAYGAGFHRLPGALLAAEATDENLAALRALATAVRWFAVYLTVRLLPVLLRTIGLGWVLWNVALVALSAAGLALLCLPGQDAYAHKALPGATRSTASSVSSSSSAAAADSRHPTPPYWPTAPPSGTVGPELV